MTCIIQGFKDYIAVSNTHGSQQKYKMELQSYHDTNVCNFIVLYYSNINIIMVYNVPVAVHIMYSETSLPLAWSMYNKNIMMVCTNDS